MNKNNRLIENIKIMDKIIRRLNLYISNRRKDIDYMRIKSELDSIRKLLDKALDELQT